MIGKSILFTVHVTIGDRGSGIIQFTEGYSAEEHAKEFCLRYGLNIVVYEFIVKLLKDKLKKLGISTNSFIQNERVPKNNSKSKLKGIRRHPINVKPREIELQDTEITMCNEDMNEFNSSKSKKCSYLNQSLESQTLVVNKENRKPNGQEKLFERNDLKKAMDSIISGTTAMRRSIDTDLIFNQQEAYSRMTKVNEEGNNTLEQSSDSSRSPSPRRGISGSISLYNRAIKSNTRLKKKISLKKFTIEKEEELEIASCTFAPKINTLSRAIAMNSKNKKEIPAYEKLFKHAEKSKKRLENVIRKASKIQGKPMINPTSRLIDKANNLNKSVDRFSKLYEKASNKQKPKPQIYPHAPAIRYTRKSMRDDRTFLDRMDADMFARQQKIDARKSTSFNSQRVRDADPGYFEYLYQEAFDRVQKSIKSEFFKLQHIKSKSEERKMSNASRNIVEQGLSNKLKSIFIELDSDNDGVISASRINIDSLTRETLSILGPLLIEMEENDVSLTELEFKGIMKTYCKVIFI